MQDNLPSLTELHYFVEAAQTGNFTQASQRLGISQGTLSAAIQRLEGKLGVPLFVRLRIGVRLSRAGQQLLQSSREMLAYWSDVRLGAQRAHTELTGRFRVGCHPSVAVHVGSRAFASLLRQHAKIEFAFEHDLSRNILSRVAAFELDFGLVINPVAHPDLVIHPVASDSVCLWKGRRASCSDLLIYDPDLHQAQDLVKRLGRKGVQFSRHVSTASLELVALLTAEGVGVGVIPARVVEGMAPGRLELADPAFPVFSDSLCLVYRADAVRGASMRRMASLLLESLTEAIGAGSIPEPKYAMKP